MTNKVIKRFQKDYINSKYENVIKNIDDELNNMNLGREFDSEWVYMSLHLIFIQSRSYIRLGMVKNAKQIFKKYRDIYQNSEDIKTNLIIQCININILVTEGKYKKGIEDFFLFESKFKIREEIDEDFAYWISFIHFINGLANFYLTLYDEAKIYLNKSLILRQRFNFSEESARNHYYLGIIISDTGKMTEARAHFSKALNLFNINNSTQGIAWIHYQLSRLHLLEGNVLEAEKTMKISEALFKQIKDQTGIRAVYVFSGFIYYQMGEIEKAKNILISSHENADQISFFLMKSMALVALVFIYLEDLNNFSEAKKYFKILKDLNFKRESNRRSWFHFKLAEGLIFKYGTKFHEKAKAQEIFRTLLEDSQFDQFQDFLHQNYWFLVLNNLCELLLEEFKLSLDTSILEDVLDIINNYLEHKAEKFEKIEYIELMIIKAKIFLIEGKIEDAIALLETNLETAKGLNYIRIFNRLTLELGKIHSEFEKWSDLLENNASLLERYELAKIDHYFKDLRGIMNYNKTG